MQLAQRGEVGLVVHHQGRHPVDPLGQWGMVGQQFRHRHVPPAQVRREADPPGVVDQAGHPQGGTAAGQLGELAESLGR